MTRDQMWFVFVNGRCTYQCFSKDQALWYIRRKLSGKMHAYHKQQSWTYQRGWIGSWTQGDGWKGNVVCR